MAEEVMTGVVKGLSKSGLGYVGTGLSTLGDSDPTCSC